MSNDRQIIVIEGPPETEIVVSGLGPVVLVGGSGRSERVLAGFVRRPHAVNYRAFANATIARSLRPSVTPAVIDALTESDRRRLTVALVRLRGDLPAWRRLYGTHLSADERFFAVTLWRWQETWESLRRRLIGARARHLKTQQQQAQSAVASAVAKARIPSSVVAALTNAFPRAKMYDGLFHAPGLTVLSKQVGVLAGAKLPAPALYASLMPPAWMKTAGCSPVSNTLKVSGMSEVNAVFRASGIGSIDTGLLSAAMKASTVAHQFSDAFPVPRVAAQIAAALGPLGAQSALWPARMPALNLLSGLQDIVKPFRQIHETMAELEFLRVWESDPLWFLLSAFGMRAGRRFALLARDDVEDVLVVALTDVVCDSEFVEDLRELLRDAPHLTDMQRDWLDHALVHAQAGEWRQAVLPLLAGLEGAHHSAAVASALIIATGGKIPPAEALIKLMNIDEDYTQFVVRRVFGGSGNSFRHGRAESGERDQVLLGIVALVGWMDHFMGVDAMGVLAGELTARLDHVIDAVTNDRQLLPSPV